MKIIDILNKIANGEEAPKKIKYKDRTYTFYTNEENDYYYQDDICYYFFLNIQCLNALNDEVEIIEEEKKIPEKIDVWYDPIKDTKLERHDTVTSIEILANMCNDLKDKYNEIIDYLQSKGE